jgi:hypothetical protein
MLKNHANGQKNIKNLLIVEDLRDSPKNNIVKVKVKVRD